MLLGCFLFPADSPWTLSSNNPQEFVSSLALYFGKVKDPQHSKDRAHFFFNIFDIDRDGFIGAQDLRLMLADCLATNNIPIAQACCATET